MQHYGIEQYNIINPINVYRNLSTTQLIEIAIKNENAKLMNNGALLVETGDRTSRDSNDKFIVEEPTSCDRIDWTGDNHKISQSAFDRIYSKVTSYLCNRNIYIFDGFAGADPDYRVSFRIINEMASQNLFMNNMLIRPTDSELVAFNPEMTLISVPNLKLNAKIDETHSDVAVLINFQKRIILIVGTKYCGEMKKAIFTVMNYLLPCKGVLSMHCSANMAINGSGETALFFGLTGSGKTTLSAEPNRGLIGDDEHGWSTNGIFNIEGGCYAKCLDLTEDKEPEIYRAIKHGALVENVVINDRREPDYQDDSITENTRVSYPVHYIDNAVIPSVGGHPKNIIFLTSDAFGVLPPVSKLTKEQAMYYFLSGYTSKVEGTKNGITEPVCEFSTCFGSPFLPLSSSIYAELLGEKIEKYGVNVYLINTGWWGGAYGQGKRMNLGTTRNIVTSALDGTLSEAEYEEEKYFGLSVPTNCYNMDSSFLNPINSWKDKKEYDVLAKKLATAFRENFKKFVNIPQHIVEAGPKA